MPGHWQVKLHAPLFKTLAEVSRLRHDNAFMPKASNRAVLKFGVLLLLAAVINLVATIAGVAIIADVYQRGLEKTDQLADLAMLGRQTEVHYKTQVHEWKNILLRGQNPDDYEKYYTAMLDQGEQVASDVERLQTLSKELGLDAPVLKEFATKHAEMTEAYLQALEKAGQPLTLNQIPEIDTSVRGIDRNPQRLIDRVTDQLSSFANAQIELTRRTADDAFQTARTIAMVAMLVQFVIVIVVLYLIARDKQRKS